MEAKSYFLNVINNKQHSFALHCFQRTEDIFQSAFMDTKIFRDKVIFREYSENTPCQYIWLFNIAHIIFSILINRYNGATGCCSKKYLSIQSFVTDYLHLNSFRSSTGHRIRSKNHWYMQFITHLQPVNNGKPQSQWLLCMCHCVCYC